jgi:hypothetical protein
MGMPWVRKHPLWTGVAIIGVLLLLVFMGYTLYEFEPSTICSAATPPASAPSQPHC